MNGLRARLRARLRVWAASLCFVYLGWLCCACAEQPGSGGSEHDGRHHDDPHEHDAAESARVVRISKEAVARSGIRLATVVEEAVVSGLQVPAEVQAEPDREAHVSSVVAGQLAEVAVSVGDQVAAGQTMAVIRSVALGEARAQVARARAGVEVARANFRRQEELRREGIGAERHYLEAQAELRKAEAAQSSAERAIEVYGRGGRGSEVVLTSPIAGRVVSRHATIGEVVAPSAVLFKVTDIARVWVVGRVYQQQAALVREGAGATFVLQSYPDRTFAGNIDYVAPALDERTRTLPVRVTLDNAEGLLRPGSFGTLSITSSGDGGARAETMPAVKVGALQRLGADTVVFVPGDETDEYFALTVDVAGRAGGLARLRQGLNVGDRYVVDGAFVLKSELSRGELGEGHSH